MLDNGKGYLYCFTSIIAALYHFHVVYFIVNLNYMYLETIILTVFLHAKSITRVPCRPRNRKLRISRHFPMARRYLSLDTAHLAVCSPGKVGYFPLERCSGRISFAWREVFSFLCHSHRVVLAFSRYILNVTRDFAHQSREFAF